MKKILITAIAFACLFALTGCSSDKTNDPHEELVIEDLVTIKIREIEIANNVEAPVISKISEYIDFSNNYDVIVEVTNTGQKELVLDDDIVAWIRFEDKAVTTKLKAESANRADLIEDYKIEPGETVVVHAYANYKTMETDIYDDTSLTFTIDEKKYKFELDRPSSFKAEKTYSSYGDNITTSENISIDIVESFVEKEISPSAAEGNSGGYEVTTDSQSFIILKLVVKNNSNAEKSLDELVGFRTVKEDSVSTSGAGMIFMETADGTSFERKTPIQPGEESIVYCLSSVTAENIDDVTELRLDTIDGTYYITR